MIQKILANYELLLPLSWSCRGNDGGFSGATIWRVSSATEHFCLRRWPHAADRDRLDWIHRVLQFVQTEGCCEPVVPMESKSRATLIFDNGHCWELGRWSAGTADYVSNPNPERLRSAVETIAAFHRSTARFGSVSAASTNIGNAIRELANFPHTVQQIERHRNPERCFVTDDDWQFVLSAGRSLAARTLHRLLPFETLELTVQPVIRDVHSEHFFFEQDRVCGLIDFGAMRMDTVACDLARMLGSMVGDDQNELQFAIELYSSSHALPGHEREIIQPLILAGWLVGTLNWMRWLHVEQREFDSSSGVQARLNNLIQSLRNSG